MEKSVFIVAFNEFGHRDRRTNKRTRGFLEIYYSGKLAINKYIEINPIYQTVRKMMDKYKTRNQIKVTYN